MTSSLRKFQLGDEFVDKFNERVYTIWYLPCTVVDGGPLYLVENEDGHRCSVIHRDLSESEGVVYMTIDESKQPVSSKSKSIAYRTINPNQSDPATPKEEMNE